MQILLISNVNCHADSKVNVIILQATMLSADSSSGNQNLDKFQLIVIRMNRLHVIIEIYLSGKLFLALRALKWFYAGMMLHVCR